MSTYAKASRSPGTDASAVLNCSTVGSPAVPLVSMAALTDVVSPSAITGPKVAQAACTPVTATSFGGGVIVLMVTPL